MACVLPIFEYGSETWYQLITKNMLSQLDKIQNTALRRILGVPKSTPIAAMEVETAIMPLILRLQYTQICKANRLKLGLAKTNPLLQEAARPGTTANNLAEWAYVFDFIEPWIPSPPWPSEQTKQHNKTTRDRKKAKKETEKRLVAHFETEWQEHFDNSIGGRTYRDVVQKVKVSTRATKVSLGKLFFTAPKKILSKLVQYRMGHAFVGAHYSDLSGGNSVERRRCPCGKSETISHIILACKILAPQRQKLRLISKTMKLSTLLNSKKGMTAMMEFIKEDSRYKGEEDRY